MSFLILFLILANPILSWACELFVPWCKIFVDLAWSCPFLFFATPSASKGNTSFFNTAGAVQNKTQKQGVPLRFVNQTPSIMSQKISLLPTPLKHLEAGKLIYVANFANQNRIEWLLDKWNPLPQPPTAQNITMINITRSLQRTYDNNDGHFKSYPWCARNNIEKHHLRGRWNTLPAHTFKYSKALLAACFRCSSNAISSCKATAASSRKRLETKPGGFRRIRCRRRLCQRLVHVASVCGTYMYTNRIHIAHIYIYTYAYNRLIMHVSVTSILKVITFQTKKLAKLPKSWGWAGGVFGGRGDRPPTNGSFW